MAYDEDNLLPLSLLSQYYYCPRRAGLLLLERQWRDNIHTVEGSILHQRVDGARQEKRSELIRLTALPLRSLRLGLFGIADSIELHTNDKGFSIPGFKGSWNVIPVEYKHGRVRDELEYEVQLTGQAICLEEMLGITISKGFIYYGGDRRRKEINITPTLRQLVEEGALALHAMLTTGQTPPIQPSNKCKECSLTIDCFPAISSRRYGSKKSPSQTSAASYIASLWHDIEKGVE